MPHFLNVSTILESTRLSFLGKQSFPEAVSVLANAGVDRYIADLTRLEKTFYSACGDSVSSPLALDDTPGIADAWSGEKVIAAIRASQQREIEYPQFLRDIMAAGCVAYLVFLKGRKAIYFGRGGELHIEEFKSR